MAVTVVSIHGQSKYNTEAPPLAERLGDQSLNHSTAKSGVSSSPALVTCAISQVLLAGVSGVFSGFSRFRPTY